MIRDTLSPLYRMAAPTMDDLPETTEMLNRVARLRRGENSTSVEVLRMEWTWPGYDLARDARVIRDASNAIVAFGGCYNTDEPHVASGLFLVVDPAVGERERELLEALYDWSEALTESRVGEAPADARVTRRAWVYDEDVLNRQVAESRGYTYTRSFLRMRIDLAGMPEAPVFPPGFRLTTLAETKDLYAVARADEDSFRDHYGHTPRSYDEVYKDFEHYTQSMETFDPALCLVAVDDSKPDSPVAGICLNEMESEQNPEAGYVATLGVVPAYRKRGLARALLVASFRALYERGKETILLHVDAASLTGATRLYESVGMRRDQVNHSYEYEIRPGRELRNLGAGEPAAAV